MGKLDAKIITICFLEWAKVSTTLEKGYEARVQVRGSEADKEPFRNAPVFQLLFQKIKYTLCERDLHFISQLRKTLIHALGLSMSIQTFGKSHRVTQTI